MRGYKTSQRELLTDYLKSNADQLQSAEKIASALCADGKISVSAVYRNLAKLVSEGYVRRVPDEGGRAMLYQYVDFRRCDSHFHLSCMVCGRVIHMDDDVSGDVLRLIYRAADFTVSENKTFLYGVCSNCR